MAARGYLGPDGQYYSSPVSQVIGPQNPEKYPHVGPNYRKFGEQGDVGYIYYPATDSYVPDKNFQKKWLEDNGQLEKKKGLADALLPIAATGATIEATRGLLSNPSGFIDGISKGVDKVGGLLELGNQATNATSAAANLGSQTGSSLGSLNLADEVGSSLFSSGAPTASDVLSGAGQAGNGAVGIGSKVGSALSTAAPYLGAAGAGLSAYQIGKNLLSGKKMGTKGGAMAGAGLGAGLAAAAPLVGLGPVGWAGLGLMALAGGAGGGILGQIGHGKNYYEAMDRNNFAKGLNEQYGTKYDPKQWEDDPTSFTYDQNSPGKLKELGAAQGLAYLLGAGDVGSKGFTDATARFANDVKGGQDVGALYQQFGFDKNKAMEGIGASSLDAQQKAALQNGINDAFSGSPGLLGLVKPGEKMRDGRTYISPGVYR